jgi:hypothetical protein
MISLLYKMGFWNRTFKYKKGGAGSKDLLGFFLKFPGEGNEKFQNLLAKNAN